MFYQTESKAQGWRALVVFKDRTEFLLYVGRSTTQVRTGYRPAFEELLEEDERAQVETIVLQCWEGAPDRGRWLTKNTLTVPGREKVGGNMKPTLSLVGAMDADDDEEIATPDLLPLPARTELPSRRLASR